MNLRVWTLKINSYIYTHTHTQHTHTYRGREREKEISKQKIKMPLTDLRDEFYSYLLFIDKDMVVQRG